MCNYETFLCLDKKDKIYDIKADQRRQVFIHPMQSRENPVSCLSTDFTVLLILEKHIWIYKMIFSKIVNFRSSSVKSNFSNMN